MRLDWVKMCSYAALTMGVTDDVLGLCVEEVGAVQWQWTNLTDH
jgi:hypothetical protein